MKKLLLALLVFSVSFSHAQDPPKRELRGVWITTHLSLDWPNRLQTPAQQQSALLGILNHNKATGMNAAFFQVRSQSDAMYPSDLEPWSYYLTNKQGTAPNPLWDPLKFAIDESRKRGMEFHAWINPYRAVATLSSAGNTAQYGPTHVSRTHPEWMLTIGTVQILNPGLPAVREHITKVIVDIVKRYDVDGIHFDDYFYPSGTISDLDAYNADPRGFPATAAGRLDWRRDNINLLIKRVSDSINILKPWVKFGVSPSGIYRSSSDSALGSPTSSGAYQHYLSAFADSKKWISSGWVDYLAPQVYWYIGQLGSDYKLLVPWWNNNAFGRHIYVGMADYKVGTTGWTSRSEIPNQIRLNRSLSNIYGQIHFRHAFLVANALNYRDSLRSRFYIRPALIPTMPWKDNVAPLPPTSLVLTKNPDRSSVTLSWTKPPVTTSELDKIKRFVVYRAQTPVIDLENANNILVITPTDENTYVDNAVEKDSTYFYTVTSVDRLYNESTMSNIVSNDTIKPVVITQNITRTLNNGIVTISANEINNGSSDNWGIQSMSLSKTTFNCADIGENIVTLTVTDNAGNVNSATAIVTIVGSVPTPAISISRTDNTYTGLPANTIALGYGAQSVTLTASNLTPGSGSGTTTYSWSPAPGLSNINTASTIFTPTSTGNYVLLVEAINEFGCTNTSSATITVIDVRCANDKVIVCKKPKKNETQNQLCISRNAVPAHLQNGGTLGECGLPNIITKMDNKRFEEPASVLSAYPNPFVGSVTVTFTLVNAENRVLLDIYDQNGNWVKRVYQGAVEANRKYSFSVNSYDLKGKLFFARLITPGKVYNFKLLKG